MEAREGRSAPQAATVHYRADQGTDPMALALQALQRQCRPNRKPERDDFPNRSHPKSARQRRGTLALRNKLALARSRPEGEAVVEEQMPTRHR
jgi:hypothetical protein